MLRLLRMDKTKKAPHVNKGPFCGDTRIRTKDTRIFSPLLYQLSYITVQKEMFSFGTANVMAFSYFKNLF